MSETEKRRLILLSLLFFMTAAVLFIFKVEVWLGWILVLFGIYAMYEGIQELSTKGHPNAWKIGVAFFIFLSVVVASNAYVTASIWKDSGVAFIENFDRVLSSIKDFIIWSLNLISR